MGRNIAITNQSVAMGGNCDGCTFSAKTIRVIRLMIGEFKLCPPCVEVVRAGLEIGSVHESIPGETEPETEL